MRPAILRAATLAAAVILSTGLAVAAGQYDPGASDNEIKIGNIMPYSGPASAYGVIGQAEAAYGDETYRKLVALKDKYDPTNVFRLNQNIAPSR